MARTEEVIDRDVQSDDEGVESGGHFGLKVDGYVNTASFGAFDPAASQRRLFRINHPMATIDAIQSSSPAGIFTGWRRRSR